MSVFFSILNSYVCKIRHITPKWNTLFEILNILFGYNAKQYVTQRHHESTQLNNKQFQFGILTRNNFNNGVFQFRIQWQIDLPEGVFGNINHDGLSILNQLKKTTNELIFTMRKWVESGILCLKYWIYCLTTMQNNKWHNVTVKALN